MQEHKDSHRSDSTKLPRQGLHGACRKDAYCLIAREEAASQLTKHHAAVKMEYMQK
jgi:hypothetical protein